MYYSAILCRVLSKGGIHGYLGYPPRSATEMLTWTQGTLLLTEEEENGSKLHFRKCGFKTIIIGYAMGTEVIMEVAVCYPFYFE